MHFLPVSFCGIISLPASLYQCLPSASPFALALFPSSVATVCVYTMMLPVSSYFRPVLFLVLPFLCWEKCVPIMQYWSCISLLPLPDCSVQDWVYCSENESWVSFTATCCARDILKVVYLGQIYEKFLQGKQTHVLCQFSLPQSKTSQRKAWNNKILYKCFIFSLGLEVIEHLVKNVWKQFGQTDSQQW